MSSNNPENYALIKGVIFDLDGVLVDSMPSHSEAWIKAFKDVAGLDVTEHDIYLLEGMRGQELVMKIFEQKRYPSRSKAEKIEEVKKQIFGKIRRAKPFEGTKEILENLKTRDSIVSGSSKADVEMLIQEAFEKKPEELVDAVITADDVKKGKPDPSAFLEALRQMRLKASEALVVENSPLGVKAANDAGIKCVLVLNNTPLRRADFQGLVGNEKILDSTDSIRGLLLSLK